MPHKNPLGLHIQRYSSPNDDWIRTHVREAEYMSCTVMDASSLSADLRRGGVPYSITRDYNFEPEPKHLNTLDEVKAYAISVYQRYVGDVNKSGDDSVHVYVNNEQGHQWQRIAMMRFMMEEAMKPGNKVIGMVFLNAAPGTIKTGNWNEPNEFESEEMMKLLLTFDKYRDVRLPSGSYAFLLGVHSYTVYYWWCAVNGGIYAHDASWDTPNKFDSGEYHVNWSLPQDHLAREYQGIRTALGYQWNDGLRKWIATAKTPKRPDGSYVEPPMQVVTECILDNMDNDQRIHPHIHLDNGAERARGYRSLITIWESNWFPGIPAGKTLAIMLEQAWRHVFEPTGYFVGFNYFCFGESGGHSLYSVTPDGGVNWDYFNQITPYRRNMPDHMFKESQVPEQPTPEDPETGWTTIVLEPIPKIDYANVRRTSDTSSDTNIVGRIQGRTTVKQYHASNPGWRYIQLQNGVKGFVKETVVRVPPTTPDPVPEQEFMVALTKSERDLLKSLAAKLP